MYKRHYLFFFLLVYSNVKIVNTAICQTTDKLMPTVTSAGAVNAYTLANGETVNFYDEGEASSNYSDGAIATNAAGTATFTFIPPAGTYLQVVFSALTLG